MKTKLLSIFFSLCGIMGNSQAPAIQWQKSLGGTIYNDIAHSIQQITDGGYIVAGISYSNDGDVTGHHGNGDFWVVKLNNNGGLQWQKALGGSGEDAAYSVRQTVDGGYIVAGYTKSPNDGDVTGRFEADYDSNHNWYRDYWIVKLDNNGNLEWQKAFGSYGNQEAFSVRQTTDGGYIVAGRDNVTYGCRIYKLDNNGNLVWQKLHGNGVSNAIMPTPILSVSIQQTTDGGYILSDFKRTQQGDGTIQLDGWIAKLDNNGNSVWEKTFGGSAHEYSGEIQQTTDGGYIWTGTTYSNDGDVTNNYGQEDMWIVKFDSNGNILWEKTIGTALREFGVSIRQTVDGGYIVSGLTESYPVADFLIVKLNSSGNLVWQKNLGGGQYEAAYSIQQTVDGGYIIAGVTTSPSNDGDVEYNHSDFGWADFWIVKLAPDNLSVQDETQHTISVYPSPVKDTLYFSEKLKDVTIYDLTGRLIKSYNGNYDKIDVSDIAKGNYILKGETESGEKFNTKFVKKF